MMMTNSIRTAVYVSMFCSFVAVLLAGVAVSQNDQHTKDILQNRRNGELTRTLLRQNIDEGRDRGTRQDESQERIRRMELLLNNIEGKLDTKQ